VGLDDSTRALVSVSERDTGSQIGFFLKSATDGRIEAHWDGAFHGIRSIDASGRRSIPACHVAT
jgi:hypothetical protein